MNFFQQNLDSTFKNKAICIKQKIFIFFSLKKMRWPTAGSGPRQATFPYLFKKNFTTVEKNVQPCNSFESLCTLSLAIGKSKLKFILLWSDHLTLWFFFTASFSTCHFLFLAPLHSKVHIYRYFPNPSEVFPNSQ